MVSFHLFKRPVSTTDKKGTKGVKQFSFFFFFCFVFLRESFVFGGRGRSDAHTTFLGMAINKTMRRRRHLENKSKMDDRVWFVFPRSQSLGNRQQGQSGRCPAPVVVTSL
jgi:hypothetical protein